MGHRRADLTDQTWQYRGVSLPNPAISTVNVTIIDNDMVVEIVSTGRMEVNDQPSWGPCRI